MAMDWQTLHIPLVAGMNQKADARALQVPELALLRDGQFDELGGIQTRYPYAAYSYQTMEGGTISDGRQLVPNGPELLLFTKDSLYSWNSQLAKWKLRGTHLAVKVDEQPVFVTTGEQTECDRAELDGLVVYAWHDDDTVYCAAVDKVSGAVVVSPVDLAAGGTGVLSQPRLVALDTVILLFTTDATSGSLHVTPIDPADPLGTISGASPIGDPTHDGAYDVTRVIGSDLAVLVQRCAGNTYSISTVAPDLVEVPLAKARTCDGPIAVSCSPTGTHAQVVRTDGNNIVGDLILLSTLADVYTAQAIGTVTLGDCYQIAAAHRSVADSGVYRCYVFWNDGNSSQPGSGAVRSNWVSTGNTLGTEAQFVHAVGLASRAFDHEGRVFVNLAFAGLSDVTTAYNDYQFDKAALQNTYFLYRDDAFLVAKQAMNRAGGLPTGAATTTGHLPGVAADDDGIYRWCGTERRIVPVGNGSAYADRGPRDIALTFDSNEARRCVRLGETLYVACGEGLLQYDGVELVEVGFHHMPYSFTLTDGAAGDIDAGVYFYKATARSQNARGEVDRSTTGAAGGIQPIANEVVTVSNLSQLYITHKTAPAIEMWRTLVNPTEDAPYYRISGSDPTDTTGNNRYLANDASGTSVTFVDELNDSDVRELEQHYETPGVLVNLAPPPASIIAATDERIFLAGVAGDPDRVWYSKKRNSGEIAAFNLALVVPVPSPGRDITALAFLNETLVVFRETAIYMLPGDGYDNTGGGTNYGPARTISVDIGAVNAESVKATDKGLIFKSNKGWYLLNRGWALEYIGAPVSDYDGWTPLAVDVLEAQHQVRILIAEPSFDTVPAEVQDPIQEDASPSIRMLMFDTLIGQWAEWTVNDAFHSCVYYGLHNLLTTTAPKNQLIAYQGVDYGLDLETAWIKYADLMGSVRIRSLEILGSYLSAHKVRIRLARDYWSDGVGTYFQDKSWTPSPTTEGGPLQVKHGPSIQQMQAIKIRITAVSPDDDDTPPSEGGSLKLTGIALELGAKRGTFRMLPAAQKQ